MTEKQIQKVRDTIKKHKAALSLEKRKFGGYDDSYGRRYVIAELYLKIADYKGAATYFRWFEKNFPDDIGYPLFYLAWAVTLFERGKLEEAKIKTIQTNFLNTYLFDVILSNETHPIDKSETIGFESLSYAIEIKQDCDKVVSKDYLNWLAEFIQTEFYLSTMNRFISLRKLLQDENDIVQRRKLIDEENKLEASIKSTIT
ncbi:tetratricopeptide repeat protein [Rhodocytophaga aerolata]|uniref:Tetratricopeptide repeat protein n=1 Tax=Rhodocytophaga aerolata TaxID=455078 RepID=A0ABT8R2K1_9BACT|nr:tetratricopeptide repeat protein [Rhodocytophaga aerolata]MDO1446330.1 tetratricopeptide repeat protein [Rhodocytophaga aerolata]